MNGWTSIWFVTSGSLASFTASCSNGMVKFATPICLARPSRLALHRTPSVSASGTFGRPVDEEEVDPGELQLLQALIERALEVGGGKLIVKELGGHENMLALQAGGAQPATQSLTDLALVAVALGGVDVAITDTERGLDRVDADRVHERHGAEPDCGNLCAVGFDKIHGMLPPLRGAGSS